MPPNSNEEYGKLFQISALKTNLHLHSDGKTSNNVQEMNLQKNHHNEHLN
uniref:Uncharacterized protein n=1 Tax=Chlorobium phaeobacteroides (strain BS1) TaxID=331678 RepID=B3ELN0_CHLPB